MKIELKNVKINERLSEESTCFSATMYVDGAKVADCACRGHGDPVQVHFVDRRVEASVDEYVKSLPPIELPDGAEEWERKIYPMKMDLELLVGRLLDAYKHAQWIKRQTRRAILFRVKGDDADSFRTAKFKSEEQRESARAFVTRKYGDAVVEMHG